MWLFRLAAAASAWHLVNCFSCPPCYTATRTAGPIPCPANILPCTGPSSPRVPCTVTEEVWSTTLVDNIFCPTVTVTPSCPTPLPCNEILDPLEPWDQSHCQWRTITHRDPESYDFCATTTTCPDPLPTHTYERCRKYKCKAPTSECGPENVEVEPTSVSATVTEGCSVAVFTGVDPCPACPKCTPAPTESASKPRKCEKRKAQDL